MSDFVFLTPQWLWALVPLAMFIVWLAQGKKQQTLIAPHLATALGLADSRRQTAVIRLLGLSWLLAVIALAGPSFQTEARPSFSDSNARVLVMDMSRSMYATDIKPNRLIQARYKALDLLSHWTEGSTGLVAYAGDAYSVSPLTSDSATISNLLPNLSPEIMPYAGSNAVSGVQLAINMMTNAGLAQGDIILITDDLDQQEQNGIQDLLSGTSWKLIIMGVGTPSGAPILLADGSLLKTESGQTVVATTPLNEMRAFANIVNGFFTPIQLDDGDISMITQVTQAERPTAGQKSTQMVEDRVNNGYWLVLLLIVPALLAFRRGFIFLFIATLIPALHSQQAEASPWLNADQQAKQAYDKSDYQTASGQFENQEWKGIAQYQAGDYQGAVDTLSQLPNPNVRSQYNLANAYAQAGELEKAKVLYERVLEQSPTNQDAQHNLEVVNQALEQQQQQQQQQQSDAKDSDSNSSSSDNQPQQQEQKEPQSGESNQPNNGSSQAGQQSASSADDSSPSDEQQSGHQQSGSEQNNSQQKGESQANEQSSPDSSSQASSASDQQTESERSVAEQSEQSQSGQVSTEQSSSTDQQEASTAVSATDTNQSVDPELRKLEQVENARDPSRLLRAQMLLQAEQKQPPQNNGKQW